MNTTCPLCGELAIATEVVTDLTTRVQVVCCPCGDPLGIKVSKSGERGRLESGHFYFDFMVRELLGAAA